MNSVLKPALTLAQLRRYAIARSLFKPTTLPKALVRMGFVQADPIRAPARAQDLTLRHRVRGYRSGDLERRYHRLDIEEDFFVNYGFLPRSVQALMHPRTLPTPWSAVRQRQAQAVLAFVAERGAAHPREVDAHFAHGKVTNWFGGSSNATTQLLDDLHYRGLLRVARRDGGTRVYTTNIEACTHLIANVGDDASSCASSGTGASAVIDAITSDARLDSLIDLLAAKYAPLPAASLGQLVSHLKGGTPQWAAQRGMALTRAKARLAHTRLDGIDWYWPVGEKPQSARWQPDDQVRLLTPFDPVVWDRRRFELFWGWAYRFEAYTPAPKRKLGYYALPLLWQEQVIGWGNLSVTSGALAHSMGYVSGRAPTAPAFRDGLEFELARIREFLHLENAAP